LNDIFRCCGCLTFVAFIIFRTTLEGYSESEVETSAAALKFEADATVLELETDAVALKMEMDTVALELEMETDMSQEILKQEWYSAD
jgi:hypothetical protein